MADPAPLTTFNVIALATGSSVIAAFVTQGVTEIRERWRARRDAAFSALDIALALEACANACASLISDSESYERSSGNAGEAHGNVAGLPEYPTAIEWKVFGIGPTTKARSFRVEVETARAMIRGHWEYGDEEEVVPLVREEAARLGRKALAMAIEFRRAWRIEPVRYEGTGNVKSYLEDKIIDCAEERKLREERNRREGREMRAELEALENAANGSV